jgi:hypothetical protein
LEGSGKESVFVVEGCVRVKEGDGMSVGMRFENSINKKVRNREESLL